MGYALGWVAADEAELANIAVAPPHRRSGVGNRLLESMREAAAALGATRMYLEVRESNEVAQAFYRSRGFAVTGRRREYYNRPREDALTMLAAMRSLLTSEPAPMQVDYGLEGTEAWHDATAGAAASRQLGAGGTAAWLTGDRVLEELRLEPDTYLAVRDRALLRLLAAREAARLRHSADAGARQEQVARLRTRHGLFSRADLDRWLEANSIDGRRLERLIDPAVKGLLRHPDELENVSLARTLQGVAPTREEK